MNTVKFFMLMLFFNSFYAHSDGAFSIHGFVWHDEGGYVFVDSISAGVDLAPNEKSCSKAYKSCKLVIWDTEYTNDKQNIYAIIDYTKLTTEQIVSQLNSFSGSTSLKARTRACIYDYLNNNSLSILAGVCGGGGLPPKPEPVSCSANDAVLNHGKISVNSINDNTAQTQMMISCDGTATGHLSLSNYNHNSGLTLTNGLSSRITINGSAGDTGANIVVPAGNTSVTLVSTLVAVGNVLPGTYSGSVVIKLNVD